MKKAKRLGTAKRFGARYGRRNKEKVGALEEQYQRKSLPCPYCHYSGVRRMSAGIWHCTKCKAKFAGRAYKLFEDPEVALRSAMHGIDKATQDISKYERDIQRIDEETEKKIKARKSDVQEEGAVKPAESEIPAADEDDESSEETVVQ